MTPRDVERKLKKIFWLKREIASKENRLADMIDEATHITAILTQTRSSEVANKPENYAVRSYELKLSLEDDIENLMQQMEEADRMIAVLTDPMERTILVDYHFNGTPLRKLEDKYHYSRKQIYNIRQEAYIKIAKDYPQLHILTGYNGSVKD